MPEQVYSMKREKCEEVLSYVSGDRGPLSNRRSRAFSAQTRLMGDFTCFFLVDGLLFLAPKKYGTVRCI